MLQRLMDLLFPEKCLSCGNETSAGNYRFLCGPCVSSLKPAEENLSGRCEVCGENLYAADNGFCHRCSGKRRFFRKHTSVMDYREPVIRNLFRRFKFGSNRLAGRDLSVLLENGLKDRLERGGYDLVAVTPVSDSTRRKRGYNQVAMVLKMCGIPYRDVLVRTGQKQHQSELSADDREWSIRGQFAIHPKWSNSISGKEILLIDDVYTTGNTADEVSRVLLEAGAAGVEVLTFFRD